jgi:glutamate racemase
MALRDVAPGPRPLDPRDQPRSDASVDAASLPIGVFDSGVGGLTVVAALRRRLPAESILYLGDTARLPYGTKSPETVLRYTRSMIAFLTARRVKAVVVACNTASSLAVPHLQDEAETASEGHLLWGVIESGAERAAAESAGRVGVIATESTTRSEAYPEALARLRPELQVLSAACPLFVPLVEEGWVDDPVAVQVAERYLAPLLEAGIDTLLLGCTHYPLLMPVLSRVAGQGVTLVDSASAVAERVARDLEAAGLARPEGAGAGTLHAFVTDVAERFGRLAEAILGEPVPLELVDVVEGR